METHREEIRRLNDRFRELGEGQGSTLISEGIHRKGLAFVAEAMAAVRSFTDFAAGNDPYGEHDFGAFAILGERLFFKIDYYDLDLVAHSPDAADPGKTHRVLTVMLASEY